VTVHNNVQGTVAGTGSSSSSSAAVKSYKRPEKLRFDGTVELDLRSRLGAARWAISSTLSLAKATCVRRCVGRQLAPEICCGGDPHDAIRSSMHPPFTNMLNGNSVEPMTKHMHCNDAPPHDPSVSRRSQSNSFQSTFKTARVEFYDRHG
jgi:hypothetical protein